MSKFITRVLTMMSGAIMLYMIPIAARFVNAGYVVPQVFVRMLFQRFHLDLGVEVNQVAT